jgi:uncharacterized membrane protein YhaH (DUF805 family)
MKYISNLFKGRINRRNFLIGLLFYFLLMMCSFAIEGIISLMTPGTTCNYPTNYSSLCGVGAVVGIVVFLLPVIFSFSLAVRRVHDLGWSAWSLLLALIPLVNLYFYFCLYFQRGQESSNKYGDNPSQNIRFPADILNLQTSEKKSP